MIIALVCTQIAILLIAIHYAAEFFAWTGKKVLAQMTKPKAKEVEETGPL